MAATANKPGRQYKSRIKWKPFAPKHVEYIRKAIKARLAVAEGAVRAGKTIDHCVVAAIYLDQTPDKIHLASGSTMPNAKLNIGDCNGFGLEHLFRGRCRWGKYKDNDALFIDAVKHGQKIVVFAGGGKRDSFRKILGNSYGLHIATEINEHYDGDDPSESFVKVAFDRQAAAIWPLSLWDLNPCYPKHRIYTRYVDVGEELWPGKYCYEHFTIDDNRSISEERRAEIKRAYGGAGSVWYERNINGRRMVAEGLVYQSFADHINEETRPFELEPMTLERMQGYEFINFGIDFGGNRSKTVFIATAIDTHRKRIHTFKEHTVPGSKGTIDADVLKVHFIRFCEEVRAAYPSAAFRFAFADSAEQYLINGLGKVVNTIPGLHLANSNKFPIKQRIIAGTTMLASGSMKIDPKCTTLIEALCLAQWDDKKTDTRLDDFTTNIDVLDAWEYSWERYIVKLLPNMIRRA